MNPDKVRPSDIPSEQVLKQMGLSDAERLRFRRLKNKNVKNFM